MHIGVSQGKLYLRVYELATDTNKRANTKSSKQSHGNTREYRLYRNMQY
jgi:hypothetical protein